MMPTKATAELGQIIQSISLNLLPKSPKFQTHSFPANLTRIHTAKPASNSLRISCSKEKDNNNLADEMLAVDLGLAVRKLSADVVQREEALKKSRELLFAEICSFEGLKSGELRKKWRRMNEEERCVLVEGFVAEWSAHFHPLSARSVKELVEEYVGQADGFSDSVSGKLFSDFRKLFGFPSCTEE